jgi:Fic family protein
MIWNWQQPDWPEFTWDNSRLTKSEDRFLVESGAVAGVMKHLGAQDREELTIEALNTEALTTSEIEGEILDRASVQSSIRRQLGLDADMRRAGPAEQGIAEMMVDLYRTFAQPLSGEMLFAWHRMLLRGRHGLLDVGRYRTHNDPMEVVSGPIHAPKVHFEAPPARDVPKEMARFIDWFNGTVALPGITRAGIAHLYFVSIHPFEDGNGRIGRAIAEKALAQGLGRPTLALLATTILIRRKAYYEALEAANKCNEVTGWLTWFAALAIEAQQRTIAWTDFLIGKTRLLDNLRGHLNSRQERALLRMLREGPAGFRGGMSAANYTAITGASPATATRHLGDMAEKGALTRTGERRHTRYYVNLPTAPVSSPNVL